MPFVCWGSLLAELGSAYTKQKMQEGCPILQKVKGFSLGVHAAAAKPGDWAAPSSRAFLALPLAAPPLLQGQHKKQHQEGCQAYQGGHPRTAGCQLLGCR